MRAKLPVLPPALAIALALLLVLPLAASGRSESPTILMIPGTAEAGAEIEFSGIDFPRDTTVVIELTTANGPFPLTTVATDGQGAFRDVMTLPADLPTGGLGVSARAAGGASASYSFGSASAQQVGSSSSRSTPATGSTSGRSASDGIVLLFLGVLLGVLAIAAMFAWRAIYDDKHQPGMGLGDDLIWNEGEVGEQPELTASDEPYWQREVQDPEPDGGDTTTTDASSSGEQKLIAST